MLEGTVLDTELEDLAEHLRFFFFGLRRKYTSSVGAVPRSRDCAIQNRHPALGRCVRLEVVIGHEGFGVSSVQGIEYVRLRWSLKLRFPLLCPRHGSAGARTWCEYEPCACWAPSP